MYIMKRVNSIQVVPFGVIFYLVEWWRTVSRLMEGNELRSFWREIWGPLRCGGTPHWWLRCGWKYCFQDCSAELWRNRWGRNSFSLQLGELSCWSGRRLLWIPGPRPTRCSTTKGLLTTKYPPLMTREYLGLVQMTERSSVVNFLIISTPHWNDFGWIFQSYPVGEQIQSI